MIDNYKIKLDNNEEILYLYINYNYEFSNFNKNKKSIINNIKDYVLKHKIRFNGNKIKLVISGIVICTLLLSHYNLSNNSYSYISSVVFSSNYIKPNNIIGSNIITINKNNSIIQLPLNEYLIGVVAATMPINFHDEALKAQTIVSRTYTLKLIENKMVNMLNEQKYFDNEELKMHWHEKYNNNYNRLKNIIYSTNNAIIKYNGKLINSVYHFVSNGYTENAYNVWGENIPYLRSVESKFDIYSDYYNNKKDILYNDISKSLGISINDKSNIVIYKNESNRVSNIYIDGIAFNGVKLRNILNLNSADYDIVKIDDGLRFITRGYGHGVGMSQFGANYLANIGYKYSDIINYYYTGIILEDFTHLHNTT